ncbi:DUF4178 domain-containing protein [Pontibacter populi]|uniref:DUF4178 domain-containing protein n=1 Tax=Pontibacter populi TaxID=890055 RepID=A0ABV1RYZ7_9BACT
MSLIRIGTTGQYQGISFEVIGRIQHFFKEGYRNHWYVITGNNEAMWLGDWAGNYSFLKEVPRRSTDKIAGSKPGDKLSIAAIDFQVELLDEETETYIEGEVPESNSFQQGFITIELLKPDTFGMAILNIYNKNNIQAFVGQYQHLEDLQLQNLREHHEWI